MDTTNLTFLLIKLSQEGVASKSFRIALGKR